MHAGENGHPNEHLKVDIRRSARSAVCICCMLLHFENGKLHLTNRKDWGKEQQKNNAGLLRKGQETCYSTSVAGKRGVQVIIILKCSFIYMHDIDEAINTHVGGVSKRNNSLTRRSCRRDQESVGGRRQC